MVSELVAFAKKAHELAALWRGPNAVENIAGAIRRISGFGGKGFRCKELILDLAEATNMPDIQDQLVEFAVVGTGPRRVVSCVRACRCRRPCCAMCDCQANRTE